MSTQTEESCSENAFLAMSPLIPASSQDPYGCTSSSQEQTQTLLNTTIRSTNNEEENDNDFNVMFLDKVKRIQRLECENANLAEQLIIARLVFFMKKNYYIFNIYRGKARTNALLEEQKEDLLTQLAIIKKQNAKLIVILCQNLFGKKIFFQEEYEKLKESFAQVLYKDGSRRNEIEEILNDIIKLRER